MQYVAVHIAMRTLSARRTQSRVLRPASTARPFIRSPGIITISPLGGTLRVITLFRLTLPRRLVAARLRPARFRLAGRGIAARVFTPRRLIATRCPRRTADVAATGAVAAVREGLGLEAGIMFAAREVRHWQI